MKFVILDSRGKRIDDSEFDSWEVAWRFIADNLDSCEDGNDSDLDKYSVVELIEKGVNTP